MTADLDRAIFAVETAIKSECDIDAHLTEPWRCSHLTQAKEAVDALVALGWGALNDGTGASE